MTKKKYPYFEKIDGRTYLNLKNASAPNVALLLLYDAYPERIDRGELIAAIRRHGHKGSTADAAVTRNLDQIDEVGGALKLRVSGVEKAEDILKKLISKK